MCGPVVGFWSKYWFIDKSQDDKINVDLRTFGFDNEALSLPRIGVVICLKKERRFQRTRRLGQFEIRQSSRIKKACAW